MSPGTPADEPSRRDVLRAGAGLLATATVASAGCTQLESFTGGGSGADVERVPSDSRSVAYVDVQTVLEDETTERLVNAYLQAAAEGEYYDGPENYEAALERAREESDLDPTKLQRVVVFGDYEATLQGEGDPFFGTLFDADWSTEDVVAALEESGPSYAETEYAGTTVYENETEYSDNSLAVLAEGQYVLGTKTAVEAAVDVESGDADGIGEDLQGAFDATRDDAVVRLASEVPEDSIPSRFPVGGDSVELDAFQEVTHTGGALYTTDQNVGVALTLLCPSEQVAQDVEEQTEALVTVTKSLESTDEEVDAFLDAIEVRIENDTNVVVSYEEATETVEKRIETFASEIYG